MTMGKRAEMTNEDQYDRIGEDKLRWALDRLMGTIDYLRDNMAPQRGALRSAMRRAPSPW